MKKSLIILVLFLTAGILAVGYDTRKNDITSDSLKLHGVMEDLKSDIVKKQMKDFLESISESKRILEPYDVDIYERVRHSYRHSGSMSADLSQLLDSINIYIMNAEILRINNLEFDTNGSKVLLADNSFKVIKKQPRYRKKETIIGIIEDILLQGNSKSSLEWIWGKNSENDAYFSTKLTYYDNRFSLYPVYRFYIGYDPLRDKNSWYFSLSDYPPPQETERDLTGEISESVPDNIKSPVSESETYSESGTDEDIIVAKADPVFDCGGGEFDLPGKINMNLTKYFRNEGHDQLNSEFYDIELNSFLKKLLKDGDKYKFIRLKGTDFIISGSEINKSNSDTVIEIKGDPGICLERISSYIYEGVKGADKKRSVELITSVNPDRLSYNAAVITVYDGQTTYFDDYKISASSETRKDKSGWFVKLIP